jgi:polar amino acid transport system ATP-binding protein
MNASEPPADAVVFSEVYKRFGSVEVLRGISGRIGTGEVVVICGPSGSGKSTLLRCINRLETIDRGQVYGGRFTTPGRTSTGSARTSAWSFSSSTSSHT